MSLARSAVRRMRSLIAAPPSPQTAFPLGCACLGGFLDAVEVDPAGIVRLIGWSKGNPVAEPVPSISLDGEPVPFLQSFRYARKDVAASSDATSRQTGWALEYLVPEPIARTSAVLLIRLADGKEFRFESPLSFIHPHYRSLLYAPDVLHREHIYGSGPPNTSVHPEILDLVKRLPGPVLDFGCGRGVVVTELRRQGTEAFGLELDSPMIRQSISPDIAGVITLYDGSFPAPFEDRRFQSVICSEVLEHIPDYHAALQEIARLATGQAVFTVPDSSAIAFGFRHGVVPWHLLEGTHVNFFNQQSLERALRPYFSKIEFARVGASHFNGNPYYVSLAAICLK